ncbi:hypothetical protein E0Z10_g6223 [Xylaria hypoxylon]|uniref:Uncharacterized protein n=1 Tax=Xylaria hypoxylon TaxID=37992 RepID=A0A4Z0YTW6_9PEZI|nr:hypothetical protein E0Z10_g6223 [Xylaria hypoxylon]
MDQKKQDKCGIGPLNIELDDNCAYCAQRRSSFCVGEWVRGSSLDILPPHDQEPHLEALPTHAPRNYTSGAATPFDNTGSVISNIGLTSSPLLLPYLLHQTQGISGGTGTGISTNTESETSAQPSNEPASEQWNVDRGESDLVPVPIHEPVHCSSSSAEATGYNDTRSGLPNDSSHYQLTPQFDSGPGVDYSIQYSSETTASAAGTLQNTQRQQEEPATRAKRKHVAVESAPNSADGSARTCAIPIWPSGMASDIMSSGWSNSLIDVSIQFSPQTWGSDEDYYTTLSRPQLHLVDCDPPLSAKSLNTPQSSQGNRTTTSISRNYECCKYSEKQRLACPFYKYEPQLHSGCMFKSFKTIGHMGQHLKQHHKLKRNHCKSCWRNFETTDMLINHTRYCIQTGGVSVDDMPEFPRMRLPVDKKWYWGWKKLFGQAAALPPCPFSHPIEDLQAHLLTQHTNLYQPEYIGRDWA